MDLFQRSLEIIKAGQDASGAFIACPNFPVYHYSWFRDGSFIAYSMDRSGHLESAARFHAWAARAILKRREVVTSAIRHARSGLPLGSGDILHTRYTLDGGDATKEEWPNFQLDGFGTWLWALSEHVRTSGHPMPAEWGEAANLAADYLATLWERPCYDCWEEFPQSVHTYTLGAIYGGLTALDLLTGNDHRSATQTIRAFLFENAVTDGHFVKSFGRTDVDGSLIGLSVPYGLVPPDDPRMLATIHEIEKTLRAGGGGVHRYAADTYYGGGEWVLLTAWLGWYYAELGVMQKADALRAWVEAQANPQGWLPEQVPGHLIDPSYFPTWQERWGEIATPLLWSHAKYLILECALAST